MSHDNINNNIAKIDHPDPYKIPILTGGKLTPDVLYYFEIGCINHFAVEATVEDKQQVARALAGIRNPDINAWIYSDCARINELPNE
ncbi:hypothetical protein AX17_004819 [Amanita inopinata Kibby_2008]|nr:hypothetical protein AX17_004819 [Amanita inopinata Kibby_2008]